MTIFSIIKFLLMKLVSFTWKLFSECKMKKWIFALYAVKLYQNWSSTSNACNHEMTLFSGDLMEQVASNYLLSPKSYTDFCNPLFQKHKKNHKIHNFWNSIFFHTGISEVYQNSSLGASTYFLRVHITVW